MYQVSPHTTLLVTALTPLPFDLRQWGDRIVLAGLTSPDQYRLLRATDEVTAAGWPVTIFRSDVVDPATGAVLGRRIHALYRFLEYGAFAAVLSTSPEEIDALEPRFLDAARRAEPSWEDEEIVALAQLWEGLEVHRRETAEPTEGATSGDATDP